MGTQYFITVHGYSVSDDGYFVLSINSVKESNVCEDIQDLGSMAREGLVRLGSTRSAGFLGAIPTCYESVVSRAVVYSLTTSESGLVLARATNNTITPRKSIYGGSCDRLSKCVGDYRL